MKSSRTIFYAFSISGLLIFSSIIFILINRFWLGSMEKRFFEFISSSSDNGPIALRDFLSDFDISEINYVCILGPYQATVEYRSDIENAPELVYEKVNTILRVMKYRRGFWGFLNSETRWAFVMFNEKNNSLRIDSMSNNRIPLILHPNGRECFATKNAFVVKRQNNQYPYGYGINIISNIK